MDEIWLRIGARGWLASWMWLAHDFLSESGAIGWAAVIFVLWTLTLLLDQREANRLVLVFSALLIASVSWFLFGGEWSELVFTGCLLGIGAGYVVELLVWPAPRWLHRKIDRS